MDLLVRNFNQDTVYNVMCTNTINVGHDGEVWFIRNGKSVTIF